MRAVWTRDLPRETEEEQQELVEFAAECGFDTVITENTTPSMATRGSEIGVDIVEIIEPYPTNQFENSHPEALQRMRSTEISIAEVLRAEPLDFGRSAFRWYPPVHTRSFLCFEHAASREFLKNRISNALKIADGVALDGFGFRNQYACFCDRCRKIRKQESNSSDENEITVLQRTAESSLLEIYETLYQHAKSVESGTIVTNHTWPPFRPNPTYAKELALDYCSQTISWFYPPIWQIDKVEFEAQTHASLSDRNQFVPFIGMHADPSIVRSPKRLCRELDLALEYGNDRVSFSRLNTLDRYEALRDVFREKLG